MNTEAGTPTGTGRTSGLAIASFICGLLSCLCLPAPAALILGIIALVQMGKDPSLKGKGFAIAGLVLSGLMVVSTPILAAIAIPNFIKFQGRAKQSECKMNLKALAVAQRMRDAEGFTENAKDLGFSPERNHRYSYLLSANPVAGETALYGDHKEALGEDAVKDALRKPLAGGVMLGLDPETQTFTAVCVGSIDNDEGADIWSVSSITREGPGGTIEAWQPYNEWNDLTDEAGSIAGSGGSKFDD